MIGIMFAASVAVQILAVLHVIRSGREQLWIWVIVLFNMLGVCAYFAFEIMPELFGPNSERAQRAETKSVESPIQRLARAEATLAEVETTANHVALADVMADMRAFEGAATHYQRALDCLHGPDKLIEMKLAEALFESGQAEAALTIVERQPASPAIGEEDRRKLLQARLLEHLGRDADAHALYADITTRLPGVEARCRYAALLIKTGQQFEARSQLEQVAKAADGPALAVSAEELAMRDWALTTLAELRGGHA